MSGLSLQDIDWLTRQFDSLYQELIAIRLRQGPGCSVCAFRFGGANIPRKEEGVKTDRPADAGETKW